MCLGLIDIWYGGNIQKVFRGQNQVDLKNFRWNSFAKGNKSDKDLLGQWQYILGNIKLGVIVLLAYLGAETADIFCFILTSVIKDQYYNQHTWGRRGWGGGDIWFMLWPCT